MEEEQRFAAPAEEEEVVQFLMALKIGTEYEVIISAGGLRLVFASGIDAGRQIDCDIGFGGDESGAYKMFVGSCCVVRRRLWVSVAATRTRSLTRSRKFEFY